MSKAGDQYYKFKAEADAHFGGLMPEIHKYVEELERDNAAMLLALQTVVADTNLHKMLYWCHRHPCGIEMVRKTAKTAIRDVTRRNRRKAHE